MRMFHGTFEKKLPSIMENGLGGKGYVPGENWDWMTTAPSFAYLKEPGIFMAAHPIEAYSWAKSADASQTVIVFEVDVDQLDPSKITFDPRDATARVYAGVIPTSALKVIPKDEWLKYEG